MKHHIIFSAILSMACATIHSMNDRLTQFYHDAHKKRSLRNELLFAHTIINEHEIPTDIAHFILQISYHLKMHQSGMYRLNFKLLSERACVDFLYFTNEQDTNFLKMWPRLDSKHPFTIELITEEENYSLYWHTLPQEITKYTVRLIKPYDD
ncbi:MAG TPA: hypothetical protein VJ201_04350 [Candidatus Babeliales bacterium]|nr:hypothetical protein [Candidatus Babeliales bacterium]